MGLEVKIESKKEKKRQRRMKSSIMMEHYFDHSKGDLIER